MPIKDSLRNASRASLRASGLRGRPPAGSMRDWLVREDHRHRRHHQGERQKTSDRWPGPTGLARLQANRRRPSPGAGRVETEVAGSPELPWRASTSVGGFSRANRVLVLVLGLLAGFAGLSAAQDPGKRPTAGDSPAQAPSSPGAVLEPKEQPLAGVRRVVFLGDSITYSGQYVEYLEAYLRIRQPTLRCEFLNLGLPSETVSGLSEPGHAGGAFPRPDLHERLGRVLEQTRPDLIIACYGMNDGIYYPFSAERFEKYQDGMRRLRERAAAIGARVLHVTPPVFDPEPIRSRTLPAGLPEYRQPYEGYDEVLARYADWLLARRADGWDVVDVHGPMRQFLAEARRRDPRYRLAGDGVHVNAIGHWLIAREILRHWGVRNPAVVEAADGDKVLARFPHGPAVLKLVQQKQRLLRDAWLTGTGHKRPGMNRGLPLDEARRQAQRLDTEILALINGKSIGAKREKREKRENRID